MAHGPNNSTLFNKQSEDEERKLIREVIGTIATATGARPRGWLGPALTESFNTLDLLAAEGIEYVGDWCNDEQPYRMNVKNGLMYSIPYSIEINDIPIFLELKKSPEDFYHILVDQFDGLYQDGERSARVMEICLHPFLIGHPFRAKYLDRALEYVVNHEGVWCATGSEIIDWYKTQEA
jgi:peptidoglycan/xylan/chitin deacetylase (PgdA/CDA1 family)